MDPQQQLVFDSEISAAVLGKGSEFVLIPLPKQTPLDKAQVTRCNARGFLLAGFLGLKEGHVRVERESAHPEAAEPLLHGAIAFCLQNADKLQSDSSADSIRWLEQLYSLPDLREES